MKKNILLACFCISILYVKSQSVGSEPHRPQFHFSPKEKWMNDPNGMVYHKGVYHLFYQYYPDSTVWGPMHWGHA
ncbi:MAG TPA: levanase, partial [Lacibacter sp.]|nr:levanase [Lacibacter sp.]